MREAAREIVRLMAEMGEDKGLEEAVRLGLTQKVTFYELYEAVATEKGVPMEVWRAGAALDGPDGK